MYTAHSGGVRREDQVVLVGQPSQTEGSRKGKAPSGEVAVHAHDAQFLLGLCRLGFPNLIHLPGLGEGG